MFVSGSCDSTARLWDMRVASRAVRTFHGHEGDVNSVKFFPDGNRFGTGSADGTCRLFDIRTGHQLQVYYQPHGDNDVPPVTSIAFSISGRLLFAGYNNGDCYVWDTLLGKVHCILIHHACAMYILPISSRIKMWHRSFPFLSCIKISLQSLCYLQFDAFDSVRTDFS